MKKLISSAFACAFLVSATVTVGQDPAAGDKPIVRRALSPIIAALDADGNGELSAEEIAASADALKKLDKNGDGKVSADELQPPVSSGGATAENADFVTRFFAKFDKNNDGQVTKDELSEQNQRLLVRGDTNEDGALDKVELEALTKSLGGESNRPSPAPESVPAADAAGAKSP